MSSAPTDTLLEIDDPDELDAIVEVVRGQLALIRTCTPARVLSYDAATERATVQPVLRGRYVDLEDERLVTYRPAPLSGRPVLWLAAGAFGVDAALEVGQEVTLVVSDRSIAEWAAAGGEDVTPADLRRFDLSDALVLPVRARPGASPRYAADSLFLGHRSALGAGLRVTSSTVALGTPTVEVLDQVQQAIAEVNLLATKALAFSVALNAAVNLPTPGIGAPVPVTQGSLLSFLTGAGLDAISLGDIQAQLTALQLAINSIRGTV